MNVQTFGAQRRLIVLACVAALATVFAVSAQAANAAPPVFDSGSLADQFYTTTSTDGLDVTYDVPTAQDISGPVAVSCNPPLGHHFPIDVSTVTCTSTNGDGTATATFDLYVVPPAGEVFWVGDYDDITLEATGPSGAVATWSLLDVFGTPSAAYCAQPSGSTFVIGTTTVTCTAVGSTLSDVKIFDVTVEDTTAPTIVVPADITVSATGPSGATVSFAAATATDIADPTPAVGCDHNSGVVYPVGTTTVTCTATDDTGNVATDSFTITVNDTTAPVISGLPASLTVEATGPAGATATWSGSASDNVDGPIALTCIPSSGSTFAIGTTTVNCSAADAAGNSTTASFPVTVEDTTGPTFAGTPASFTQEQVPGTNTLQYTAPTATDLVDGPVLVVCTPPVGTIITAGPHVVTCMADDSEGNLSSTSFTVTLADTTDPVVSVPSDFTAEAMTAAGALITFSASATDSLDGPLPVTCTPASGTTFPIGTTGVSCTATDAAGNSDTKGFNVTVQDTTGPIIGGVPADFQVEQTLPLTFINYTMPTANDAVNGPRPVNCVPPVGSQLAPGVHTVTCTAEDLTGNSTSATFDITISDTTAPVIDNLPMPQTVEATGPAGAIATFTGTATDSIDGVITLVCVPGSGTTFALGVNTVVCTATDAAGNSSNASFTVTIVDTTAPAFSGVPSTITEEATGPTGAAVTFTPPTATDIVDGAVTVNCDYNSGDTFPLGTTTVTCTATDAATNSDSVTFDVIVEDTTGPAFADVPADFQVSESTAVTGTPVTYVDPTATDLVDGATTVTCVPASGTDFAVGVTTVTCTSTDAASNSSTADFEVTVVPRPTVSIASPVNGSTITQGQFVTADFACAPDPLTTIDTCEGTVADNSAIDTTTPGTKSFTVTATDVLGGVTTSTVGYTVVAPTPVAPLGVKKTLPFRIIKASRRSRGRIAVTVRVPSAGKLEFITTHVVARTSASPLAPGPGRFAYSKRSIRAKRSGNITLMLYPRKNVASLLAGEKRPLLRLTVRYSPTGGVAERKIKMVRP